MTGLIARTPVAMAPGMGLNSYFSYSIVLGEKVAWPTALGMVFISGLIFLILTLFGLRRHLVEAIPRSLVYSISVGIGLFITFMGLTKMGVITADPVTFVPSSISANSLTVPHLSRAIFNNWKSGTPSQ